MEKRCRYSYSHLDDSIVISCKEGNENIKESFMFDDFIFHLTGRGKIVGLQIRNFSQLLSEANINTGILENLKNVYMNIVPKKNSLFLGLRIISIQSENRIPLGRIFMPPLIAK